MLPMCIQVALIINGKVRSSFLFTTSPPHPLQPLTIFHSYHLLILSPNTQSLGFALDDSIKEKFLELSLACKSVICCRYTFPHSLLLPPPPPPLLHTPSH